MSKSTCSIEKKRILIIDDEERIREILRVYIEHSGYEVFEAANGKEALKILREQKIHLVILDLLLPDIQGEELCKDIRRRYDLPIIMVTGKTDESSMVYGLSIGADDYIVKPFSLRNVVARIEAVLRRYCVDSLELVLLDDYLSYDFEKKIVMIQGDEVHLTPTEYKIFETLATSPNRIFSRAQLIAYALGDEFDGYDRSIDTYIKGLRQKIEPNRKKPKYVVTVHGIGYRFMKE
ncbi:response regulator transcription factor [Anaerosporobacter sp.]|uniref:response regulator transcription factor n=1 Tax=Anaerosporobacter sp. TaxID=1872529 RepID=UPI00286F2460|nr:response regulator transcription factor [Anaerosporobacter sp.]